MQLHITYKGKDYTLEYTRRSVEQMERSGFVAEDITVRPMTTLPSLFYGAFFAHHRGIKRDLVDEIFEHTGHKDQLIGKLAEMYNEPIAALLADPAEADGDGGNVTWTADW